MLIRDLPTGATFRRGLHAYRIVGETYATGPGRALRRDAVRTDGTGGVLHIPALWTAHRDPGRHVDPNVDPDSDLVDDFDPARVPVGGTVRGGATGRRYAVTSVLPARFKVAVGSLDTGVIGSLWFDNTRRDPGRHRGGDDTRPGPDPLTAKVPSIPVPDGTPYRLEDHATGEVLERGTIVGGETVADGVTWIDRPALAWTLDGHGNVRVPLPLVRALLSDLRTVTEVRMARTEPNGDLSTERHTLDRWPAAREFILGAREV